RVVVRIEPVGAPLPHVADGLPYPVLVRGEAANGSRRQEAVFERVLAGESSLPDVGAPSALVDLGVAPRILRRVQAAPGRVLPVRLAGKAPARPVAVGLGVVPAGVADGVIPEAVQVGVPATGVRPVRASNSQPRRRLRRLAGDVFLRCREREVEYRREPELL